MASARKEHCDVASGRNAGGSDARSVFADVVNLKTSKPVSYYLKR